MRYVFKKALLATIIGGCLSTAAFATQINLTVGNDLVTAKDTLNINRDFFTGTGFSSGSVNVEESQLSLTAVPLDYVPVLMSHLNESLQNKTIVDQPELGHISTLTLGYRKDGKDIYPINCKINVAGKNVINIVINEAGCVVS